MRTIGLHQLGQMKFDRLEFEGYWQNIVGKPTKNHSCIIYGNSGNGKTTAIINYVKNLIDFNFKVGYVSHEEGISGTMQDAFRRAGLLGGEYSGDLILIGDTNFEETLEYFSKRSSPDVVVIDSVDYCDMTKDQYIILRKKLKNKIIILISWSQGTKPKSQAAKDIEYMVDVKLFVKNFMIWPKSRYGGNQPGVIWEQRARLMEPKYFADLDKNEKAQKNSLFAQQKLNEEHNPLNPDATTRGILSNMLGGGGDAEKTEPDSAEYVDETEGVAANNSPEHD
jgi:hypothetical protein